MEYKVFFFQARTFSHLAFLIMFSGYKFGMESWEIVPIETGYQQWSDALGQGISLISKQSKLGSKTWFDGQIVHQQAIQFW